VSSGRALAYLGMTIGAVGSVAANVAVAFIPPNPIAPDTPAGELTRAQIRQLADQPFMPDIVQIIWGVMIAVALFVAVQVLERIDWPDGLGWLAVRLAGAGLVAGVAAAWSYYHLTTLLLHSLTDRSDVAVALCFFGSFIVEGLMALCSAALLVPTVARVAEDASAAAPARTVAEAPAPAPTTSTPSRSGDGGAPERVARPAARSGDKAATRTTRRKTARSAKDAEVAALARELAAGATYTPKELQLAKGWAETTARRHLKAATKLADANRTGGGSGGANLADANTERKANLA
jgi:hypothetical protein